jgi:predicted secreted protein
MKCGHQILLNNCLFHACRHLCQESGHNSWKNMIGDIISSTFKKDQRRK